MFEIYICSSDQGDCIISERFPSYRAAVIFLEDRQFRPDLIADDGMSYFKPIGPGYDFATICKTISRTHEYFKSKK